MTQQEKFLERFKGLMKNEGGKKETQDEFATRLGLARGTVAKYCSGGGMPVSEVLAKICEKCDVSSDYLLGLSDVRKPDTNLKSVVEYTGLTEDAVSLLHSFSKHPAKHPADRRTYPALDCRILSAIITSPYWRSIQLCLSEMMWYLYHSEDEDIEQHSDNIDVRIFRASQSFTNLLDMMAYAFYEIPEQFVKNHSLDECIDYLAKNYPLLHKKAKEHEYGESEEVPDYGKKNS